VPDDLVTRLLAWFEAHGRALPWRRTDAWGVLVSEFMLQQTPVDRVLPVWQAWRDRWPTPASLAEASLADALRAWGRLGYPRRAARLHASAQVIVREHGGTVPEDPAELRRLPGIGEYTAGAVLAFAHGRRALVLDTNVRRVLARVITGHASPPGHITAAERTMAEDLWPADDATAARWSAAVMEFGAVVCRARTPLCDDCFVADLCAWRAAGYPPPDLPPRRQPQYEGSDRQARGALLSVLRESDDPVPSARLARAWPDDDQRRRALDSLLAEGLVERLPRGRFGLPG
jgi:A/G-specific adenine glycosylase